MCTACRAEYNARKAEYARTHPKMVSSRAVPVDEIAVDAAIAGILIGHLTTREKRAAAALLIAKGSAPREVAERIGLHLDTVRRYRQALLQNTTVASGAIS